MPAWLIVTVILVACVAMIFVVSVFEALFGEDDDEDSLF